MANASGIRAGAAYVELFLRDNRLVRGLNAAAARLKAFGASVTTLGTRLAGFGALLGTPLVAAVKTFADMGDHVAKAAARLGVTTEALSELRYATERSGGTADDLEKSLRAMSKTVIEAARGALDARRELQRLGLTVHDLSGLSSDQQLELIADRLAQIANPANRATIALGIFGKSGAKLLPLLAAGGRVILTTAEHPFYAQGKGWVAAGELEVGDRLAGEERGSWLTVTQLRSTSREVPVYNMRVADYHTYFVGDQDWGFAVWSHNTYAPTANERP